MESTTTKFTESTTTKFTATKTVSHLATTESAEAATVAAAAATSTASQRYRWRSQANRATANSAIIVLRNITILRQSTVPNLDTHRRWQSLQRNATGFDITVTQLRARDA
jgi:hypothetical protein